MAKSPKKRPAKPVKGDVIRMRVTVEHKRAMQDAADKAGLELSQWLRQLGLRAAGVLSN